MRRALVFAATLSACSFTRSSSEFTCSVTADCEGGRVCEQGFCVVAAADALPPDAPLFTCTDWTPAPRHFDPCMIPLPKDQPLVLDMPGVYTYDTTTGMLADPNAAPIEVESGTVAAGHVLSVSSLTIAAGTTLRVTGDAPLIIAAWADMTIAGAIDAGSKPGSLGPGANPTECATHAATRGGNSGDGGGGSGGGGFRGAGGNGGDGDQSGPAPNGIGGAAVAQPLLLGGCPGAAGGVGDTLEGAGGAGGGAIQLTAQQSIMLAGSVNAGGQGGGGAVGDGGNGGSGGGGGGSGGMIGIETPTLTVTTGAFVTANGGGGGQAGGGRNGNGINGAPGEDGTAAIGRPLGGNVNMNNAGGRGGAGSGGAILVGGVGQDSVEDGGGGGGGGAGYIVILSANATITGATISPAQQAPL